MTVVLDKILWSNLIGLWLDCQNFLSVMGRNKQVWNNAAPVATLQLKTAFNERGNRPKWLEARGSLWERQYPFGIKLPSSTLILWRGDFI